MSVRDIINLALTNTMRTSAPGTEILMVAREGNNAPGIIAMLRVIDGATYEKFVKGLGMDPALVKEGSNERES